MAICVGIRHFRACDLRGYERVDDKKILSESRRQELPLCVQYTIDKKTGLKSEASPQNTEIPEL